MCSCKNSKYVGSIIDDSVITCNETRDTKTTVPTKTVLTKNTFKKNNSTKTFTTKFYILLAFFINCHSIIDSC